MDDSIRSDVTNILSKDDKRKFYVYALCEKKNGEIIPFYIGKGEGERVWAHEDGEAKERKKIKDVDSDEYNEISEKHKKIRELNDNSIEVEKIIIKWGMTEDEAFMAESALINFLKIDNLKVSKAQGLTNIQNGHMSKVEKDEGIPTKARSVKEFYDECAIKSINISDIPCKNVMIRNINKGYPYCINQTDVNKAVRETVRAFWREGNPNKIDYVFAAYKGRVVGVYKVVKEKGQKNFYSILNYLNGDPVTGFPTDRSLTIRRKDLDFIENLKDYYGKNKDKGNKDLLSDYCKDNEKVIDFFGNKDDYPKALKNFIHRKYYNLKDVEDEKIKDIVGRRVKKDDGNNLFNQQQTYVMVNKDSTSK